MFVQEYAAGINEMQARLFYIYNKAFSHDLHALHTSSSKIFYTHIQLYTSTAYIYVRQKYQE
jgi:hypothetical protein